MLQNILNSSMMGGAGLEFGMRVLRCLLSLGLMNLCPLLLSILRPVSAEKGVRFCILSYNLMSLQCSV